jgi:prepilin-type N-terminal cleavage/methylation domain-containing protein
MKTPSAKILTAPTQKGFTLIEIVIVLALLSFLFTFLYSTIVHTSLTVRQIENSINRQHKIRTTFEGMMRELRLISASTPPLLLSANPTTGSNQTPLFFEATRTKNGSTIQFMVSEGGIYMPGRQNLSGLVQIKYRVERDPNNNRNFYLVRDELPVKQPAKKAFEEKITFPVNRNLSKFYVRLYNSARKEWSDQWGASQVGPNANNQQSQGSTGTPTPTLNSKVPALIELNLEFESSPGVIRKYTTVVATSST